MERGCPLCRAPFTDVAKVPSLGRPKAWFGMMDVDGNGRLDQREVFHALAATMPLDYEALEAALPALLPARRNLQIGTLTFSDLFGSNGLLLMFERNFQRATPSRGSRVMAHLCPDLGIDKQAWFMFWDSDGSGSLEQQEIVRGLVKSFKSDLPTVLFSKKLRMRYVVDEMWPLIDTDANGRITLDEFCRPEGLADLILQRFAAKDNMPGFRSQRDPLSPGRMLRRRRSSRSSLTSSRSSLASQPASPRRRPVCGRRPSGSFCPARRLLREEWTDPSVTDIADSGDTDKPSLAYRPALGFRRSARSISSTTATPAGQSTSPQELFQDTDASSGQGDAASWSVIGRLRSKEIGIAASPWITEPVLKRAASDRDKRQEANGQFWSDRNLVSAGQGSLLGL